MAIHSPPYILNQICQWGVRNLLYIPDHKHMGVAVDSWSSPTITEARKGGDCDDHAVRAIIRAAEENDWPATGTDLFLCICDVYRGEKTYRHAMVDLQWGPINYWADPTPPLQYLDETDTKMGRLNPHWKNYSAPFSEGSDFERRFGKRVPLWGRRYDKESGQFVDPIVYAKD